MRSAIVYARSEHKKKSRHMEISWGQKWAKGHSVLNIEQWWFTSMKSKSLEIFSRWRKAGKTLKLGNLHSSKRFVSAFLNNIRVRIFKISWSSRSTKFNFRVFYVFWNPFFCALFLQSLLQPQLVSHFILYQFLKYFINSS